MLGVEIDIAAIFGEHQRIQQQFVSASPRFQKAIAAFSPAFLVDLAHGAE